MAGSKKGVSSGAFRIAAVGKAALTAAPEKAPPVNKWSAVSRPVEEIKPFASTSTVGSSSSRLASPADNANINPNKPRTRARRVIANPPAMTLEDAPLAASTAGGIDVNGFAASAAGKKLAAQQNKKRGKKKRGGAGAGDGGPHEDPALAFADVPYDPARPCDYVRALPCLAIAVSCCISCTLFFLYGHHGYTLDLSCSLETPAVARANPCSYLTPSFLPLPNHAQSAYKTHLRLMRAQRRLQREEEERQRRQRREGSWSGSSYYSEDDHEENERRKENEPREFACYCVSVTQT